MCQNIYPFQIVILMEQLYCSFSKINMNKRTQIRVHYHTSTSIPSTVLHINTSIFPDSLNYIESDTWIEYQSATYMYKLCEKTVRNEDIVVYFIRSLSMFNFTVPCTGIQS